MPHSRLASAHATHRRHAAALARGLIAALLLPAAPLVAALDAQVPPGADRMAVPGPPAAPAAPRPFGLDDLARMVRISDPQVAPDGRAVAAVVSRADLDANRWTSELVLVDVAGCAPAAGSCPQRLLSADRRGLAQPRWSPSGDQLAFIARVGEGREAVAQLFVLPATGPGEARRLTTAPRGVQHFAWRPDGQAIAFAAADEPAARTGVERHNDSFEVGNDDFLVSAAPTPTHVWLVAADGASPARRLTAGRWSLPTVRPPGPPAAPPAWSPDGRRLAFAQVRSPHTGDFDSSTVQLLEVATGALRPLTAGGAFESYPVFSPDGATVAYWRPRDADPNNVSEVHVAPAAGSAAGAGRSLTRALDRNVARAIWMPGGQSLLVGANDGTRVSLWLQPTTGTRPARRLDLGGLSPSSSFWVDMSVARTGAVAFTASSPARPTELYYLASPTARPRRLTNLNAAAAGLALGRTEVVHWTSGGFAHNGVLTYPPGWTAGRRAPLVLVIHGGPRAASMETFAPQAQLMAARGWLVFQPNYRGSDQLGNAYQRAIAKDAGAGPGRDVMAGVAAVAAKGVADTARMAVSGWSYGGYMTTWLAGNYPGAWKAAVAGAPVTDNVDQYALGDANVRRRYTFGGSPFVGDGMRAYMEQSPITYASKIRAPTLVMHNTGDDRVTVTQSFKLYHALQDNNVPTKFIAYPIPGHNAADPVRQRDVQRRWMEWIEQHLGGVPTATR